MAGGYDELVSQSVGVGHRFHEQIAAQEPSSAGLAGSPKPELTVSAGRGDFLLPAAANSFVCLADFHICLLLLLGQITYIRLKQTDG